MRLYDFSMKLHGIEMPVGGVGGVAVDFSRKKEKAACELLQFCLRYYRGKGASLTALYPFRPDFYKKMGFGYGRKLNQYQVSPLAVPKGSSKANVRLLQDTELHRAAFIACYERYRQVTNGLMAPFPFWLSQIFNSRSLKVAAYWEGAVIRGYLIFSFEAIDKDNFLRNKINIRALVYESPQALSELLTFLHSQADQIETIIFNSQEEDFHYVLKDPRNGSNQLLTSVYHEVNVQGVGIMYRAIDVPGLFDQLRFHDFGGQSCRLKLTIFDSFLPENEGSWVLVVADGRAHLEAKDAPFDVALGLEIAEFSSLITGAVTFDRLYRYGLAQLSDPGFVNTIHDIFYTKNKPICMTTF